MTAGTVVITGGILATVILLCIIAVLCYCRLQVFPKDGEGDLFGLEPEGWLCRGRPQEDREGRGPGCSGGGTVIFQERCPAMGLGESLCGSVTSCPVHSRLWLRLRETQGLSSGAQPREHPCVRHTQCL